MQARHKLIHQKRVQPTFDEGLFRLPHAGIGFERNAADES